MFYECTVAGQWKETYRSTIRDNRWKHGLWRFGPDEERFDVVRQSVKNWFNPENHQCNKDWSARHGRLDRGRRVREACGKWRLPSTIDGWPRSSTASKTRGAAVTFPARRRPRPPRPPPRRPPARPLPLSRASTPAPQLRDVRGGGGGVEAQRTEHGRRGDVMRAQGAWAKGR